MRSSRNRPCQRPVFRRSERGFNLIELLMAMGISGVIFMAITMLYTYQAQTLQTQTGVLSMHREARFALDHLRRDLSSMGSNTTPNSDIDGMVCPKPGVPLRVISAKLDDGYVYKDDLNPNMQPVSIRLFGSLDVRTRYKVAAISGAKVVITDASGGSAELPETEAIWNEIFSKDRYLRISGADSRMFFYPIASTSFTERSVTLTSAPPRIAGAQRCGYQALGNGMWVDVQGFIRYRVIADTRPGAPEDESGVATRGVLVRERLATDGTTLVSQLALAENVIELAINDLGVDLDPNAAGVKLQIYPLQNHSDILTNGGGGLLGSGASAKPETIRFLTIKLSLRTEVPDRDLMHVPRVADHQPIQTYRLEKNRPTTCRVLTMGTRISMPTMVSRNL